MGKAQCDVWEVVGAMIVTVDVNDYSGWCFQIVLFFPLLAEMIQFDESSSNGLKPPTSY